MITQKVITFSFGIDSTYPTSYDHAKLNETIQQLNNEGWIVKQISTSTKNDARGHNDADEALYISLLLEKQS